MKRSGLLMVAAMVLIFAAESRAAGMSTHIEMTRRGIEGVTVPELKKILEANRDAALSGSVFPDFSSASARLPQYRDNKKNLHRAHHPDFVEAYLALVREECAGDYDSRGPLLAHFLGTAAHDYEDQVYDVFFMARAYEMDYGGDTHAVNLDNTADLGLVDDYHLWFGLPNYFTPYREIIEVYRRIGVITTAAELRTGSAMHKTALVAERFIAPGQNRKYKKTQPWTGQNIMDAPGGVVFTAKVISKYFAALWDVLNGRETPMIFDSYPEPDGTIPSGDFVSVFFVNQIDKDSVSSESLYLIDENGEKVPGASTNYRYQVVSFKPAKPLAPGRYTLIATDALRETSGRNLTGGFKMDLTVSP